MSDIDPYLTEFHLLDEKRSTQGLAFEEEQRWEALRQWLASLEQPLEPQAADGFTQPMGYYAEDGNWYPYPAEEQAVDPNAAAYDPNGASDQNAMAYSEVDATLGGEGAVYDPRTGLYVANDGYDVAPSAEGQAADYNPAALQYQASALDGGEVPVAEEADVLEVDEGLVTTVDESSPAPDLSESPPQPEGYLPEPLTGESTPVLDVATLEMEPPSQPEPELEQDPQRADPEPAPVPQAYEPITRRNQLPDYPSAVLASAPAFEPEFGAAVPLDQTSSAVPDDLAGSADDVVPLAATNDFVSYQPSVAPQEVIELALEDAAPVVESGPLAGMSQDVGSYSHLTLPPPEEEAVAPTLELEQTQAEGVGAGEWPDSHTDPGIPFENAQPETLAQSDAAWSSEPITLEAEPLPPDWVPPAAAVPDESQAILLPREETPTAAPTPQPIQLVTKSAWPPEPRAAGARPGLGTPTANPEDGSIDIDMGPTGSFSIPTARPLAIPQASQSVPRVQPPPPVAIAPPIEVAEPEPELLELELIEEVPAPPPPPPPAARPTAPRTLAPKQPPSAEPVIARPAPASTPEFLTQSFVPGEHRVIVHTLEGQVKRGTVRDLDLIEEVIRLEQQSGSPEKIPTKRVKAIFFMLPPGSRQPAADGEKIRVTFLDGRQVAGFSQDFRNPDDPGFFVVPADNRTNTARIYIFRTSVQAVAVG